MKKRIFILGALLLACGISGRLTGLTPGQSFILSVFAASILGTLLFWDLRLAFVFLGSGVLLMTGSVDMEHFVKFASLDVIIFLIGMMIIVGMMKESGIFRWIVCLILKIKGLSGRQLFIAILILSAVLSALTGEVTSIIVMTGVILDVAALLGVSPIPLVIAAVMATNIGSAATVLGNPIGILIALRAGLSFEDFLVRALPVSFVVLVVTIAVLCIWYRDYIRDMTARLAAIEHNQRQFCSISFDSEILAAAVIFGGLVISIALHGRLESLLGLEKNELLIVLPVVFAGIVLLYRRERAIFYVEHDIEWKSLLFFLFLFAQAGVIQSSGIAQIWASKLVQHAGSHPKVLSGVVLSSSGILSGFLDNTVVVASYIPMVTNLHELNLSIKPLWWAMLFGACFGGNLTVIGSTANIVAMDLLEKQKSAKVSFIEWFKLGLLVCVLSMAVAYLAVAFIPLFSR